MERIIAATARTNSNKATGPVGRVIRDLALPVAMKLVKPEKSPGSTTTGSTGTPPSSPVPRRVLGGRTGPSRALLRGAADVELADDPVDQLRVGPRLHPCHLHLLASRRQHLLLDLLELP
ncbi:hypothetical protein ABIA33_001781 [Streptacidiphilus sp. MAP12-16]